MESIPHFVEQAVPFFLLLIALEEIYARITGSSVNTLRDTLCSISLGLLQQVVGLWIVKLSIIPYQWVYDNFRLVVNFPKGLPLFFATFLLCDLMYYTFHRTAHCWHLLWAAHSVHHSGERYNLATALRQGSFQPWSSWVFYLPLALVGIPPASFACHSQLNTLYQFWIHTEVVYRLPWPLEGLLNTPSHHRMHHQPPGNCNYAGVLIIWDRLFGTFKDELETRVLGMYGLAKPAGTYDPVALNLLHFQRILSVMPGSDKTGGGEQRLTVASISRNFKMIFAPRAVHAWTLDLWGTVKGLASGYSWSSPHRLPLPLPDDVLEGKLKESVNSREKEFLLGRQQREGVSFFESPLGGLLSLLWFIVAFVAGHLVMTNVAFIQELVDQYAPVSLKPVLAASSDSQLPCNVIVLTVMCLLVSMLLSSFSSLQTRLDAPVKVKRAE